MQLFILPVGGISVHMHTLSGRSIVRLCGRIFPLLSADIAVRGFSWLDSFRQRQT